MKLRYLTLIGLLASCNKDECKELHFDGKLNGKPLEVTEKEIDNSRYLIFKRKVTKGEVVYTAECPSLKLLCYKVGESEVCDNSAKNYKKNKSLSKNMKDGFDKAQKDVLDMAMSITCIGKSSLDDLENKCSDN